MSWGILRKHLITGTFICGLALLTAQWAATQTRFNVQSSGRGLQNAKMGAQINQLQAENDAQQAELDAKKPHADATLATCGVGSGTVNNKITWNASTNTWGCIEETDPNVQDFALDSYTAPANCTGGQILTMESKKLKCTASSGTGGFEVDPTVFDFTHNTYSLPSCAASQVLTLKTVGASQRLGCVSGSALSNFEVDPTVKAFAKKNLPTCGAGKILTSDGTDFVCIDDGEGVTMEVDPTVKSFAKNNLPNCTGNQVLKANGSAFSCVSAVTQSTGNNAGTIDGLDSSQFLRSDANDTATGILTLNNQVRINSYLMQDSGSSYDVWLQGNSTSTGGGTARNLALLGVKSSDTLYVNYNREYTGGTIIGGPVTINGGDFATNAGHIWSGAGHVGRDANNSIRFDADTGAYWRIGGTWEYRATPTAFMPYANNANHLGANANRWANGYFAGTVYGGRAYISEDIPNNSGHNISLVRSNDTYQSLIGWVSGGTQQFNIGTLSNKDDFYFSSYDGGKFYFVAPVSAPSFTGSGAGLTGVVKTETDPQVGTLTNGKWCKAVSGTVNCTFDEPSGGGNVSGQLTTQNGYVWLGELLIQFGKVCPPAGQYPTYSYQIPFPTRVLQIVGTRDSAHYGATRANFFLEHESNSTFRAGNAGMGGCTNWMAIGL